MTLEAAIAEAHRAGLKLHRLSELWSDTHPWVCEMARRDAQGGLVCPGEKRGWGATPEAAMRAALAAWVPKQQQTLWPTKPEQEDFFA